jgi:ABC-type transport system involved in cytochrome bd biosynthesis fused ATPase/permease subunit
LNRFLCTLGKALVLLVFTVVVMFLVAGVLMATLTFLAFCLGSGLNVVMLLFFIVLVWCFFSSVRSVENGVEDGKTSLLGR